MSDFAEYAPGTRRRGRAGRVAIRAAAPYDVEALAAVMSARGGSVDEHFDAARRMSERLPVLLVAETEAGLVGWSGASKVQIQADEDPEWLIAGLTVVPGHRRRGIAARLLTEVLAAIRIAAPDRPVFSVINARNSASIALHERLGFREVARAATFAGITFAGGEGVLLRSEPS